MKIHLTRDGSTLLVRDESGNQMGFAGGVAAAIHWGRLPDVHKNRDQVSAGSEGA